MERNPDTELAGEDEAAEHVGLIGRQASRGLRWSLLGNMVLRGGSFLMGLVLVRLIDPDDFGIYAIALAATQFVMTIKDIGIIAATVQWRGKLEDMAPTATVLSFISAVLLYLLFYAGAPMFAELAGSADATPVVRILTAVILVEAVTAVRAAALLRRFEQDKLTKAILSGFVVNAAVAITLAMNGAGAYSFAWGQLSASVVTGIIIFFSAAVPFKLGYDRAIASQLLRFGLPSAAGTGLEAVLLNVGFIIVGAVHGVEANGYYLLAFNVSSWVPGLIGTAIRYVSIPSFSRLAENDSESLSLGVQRSVPLLVAAILPISVVMVALAHPLIAFLYEPEWDQAAGVLRFLGVLMIVRMVTSFAFDILTGQGAAKATMWMNLGTGIALVPAVYVGTHLDGIRGAAIGHLAAATLVGLPLAAWALHRAGVRLGPIFPALVRPLLGGAVSCGATVFVAYLVDHGPLVELIVAGGAGILTYVLIVVPGAVLKDLGGKVGDLIPGRSR
ncbi:oligosaccharide flippase family protein [Acrocarpospora sp. B8E8]|uniref:oligosaccharide flippase family protein n=1 Tax=Acrocarpospora sp. B8E8 TaxID=3153572 RepID=UPI00325E3C57